MSQLQYASPLKITITPSMTLLAVVSALHFGAAMIVAFSSLPFIVIKILLATVIVCSFLRFLVIVGMVRPRGWLEAVFPMLDFVVWRHDDKWILHTTGGEELVAEITGNSFVHPWLTVVKLKIEGKPWYCRYRALVFLADNIDREIFRRLRIRLRWCSMPNPDNSVVPK